MLPWNNLAAVRSYLEHHGTDTAAVIMELVMCNTGVIPPAPDYLHGVRRLCDEHGVILIADEVVTGFRLSLRGAQALLGVTADLAVFAKALGGGVPVAALTGRQSLLSLIGSGAVNHSGTYNSSIISVAAAVATIDALAANDGAAYSKIERQGQALIEGIRSVAHKTGDNLVVQGYPSVFNTSFSPEREIADLKSYQKCDQPKQQRFLLALLERGVRPTSRGTWFVSAAHSEVEVDRTLAAVTRGT